MNIYLINNNTEICLEKDTLIDFFLLKLVFSRFDSEQEPDPLFHETDQRIRIHIKMKRIHNTDF